MNQAALDQAHELCTDLYHIQNIFDQHELNEILSSIESQTDWQHLDLQEHTPRRSLAWKDDGLLDYVWGLINQLDFSRFGLRFVTVSLWKDQHPYFIAEHTDNDRVRAAMQIYLNDGPRNLGTWFGDIEIPYISNTGYIMDNRGALPHGMKTVVPPGFTRYSIYALFEHV